MSRRRCALTVVVFAAVVSGVGTPASAQPHFPFDRKGPVVAGPTPSGAKLIAYDHRGVLCLSLLERNGGGGGCGNEAPALRSPGLASSYGGRGKAHHYGTVVPEVAAVEVVFADGYSARTETSAGEKYRGRYAGRMRFFLVEVPPKRTNPLYMREFAADGALLAAVDVSYFGVRVGKPVTVARGRVGARRWRVRAFQRRKLAPLPRESERLSSDTCVALAGRPPVPFYPGPLRAEVCADSDRPFDEMVVTTDSSCHGLGAVVTGLASRGITRVTATLGSGAHRRLPLRRLPQRFGPRRAFALALPPWVAVRRVTAFAAGGRRVGSDELGLAPGSTKCGEPQGFGVLLIIGDLPPPLPPAQSQPSMLIRDEGVLLCVAIDAFALDGSDCARPPLDLRETRVLARRTRFGSLAAGVTPPEVATVELVLDGDERTRVPTTPLAGPSRYDGQVRSFSLALAGQRRVYAARLLDANGRKLQTLPGPDSPPPRGKPVTLLRGPGAIRLRATEQPVFGVRRSFACLMLRIGGHDDDSGCDSAFYPTLEVDARCSPRRLAVWGTIRRGRKVTVRTNEGLIEARTARLPRRLGARRDAFLLVVPPKQAPRELIVVGQRVRRRALRLPPVARQCGYEANEELPT